MTFAVAFAKARLLLAWAFARVRLSVAPVTARVLLFVALAVEDFKAQEA